MPPEQQTRNSEAIASFAEYCKEHPDERFWQALRNWSGYPFVFAGDVKMDERGEMLWPDGLDDTFYWEGKHHK